MRSHMFLWRNDKKTVSDFWIKKKNVSGAMIFTVFTLNIRMS